MSHSIYIHNFHLDGYGHVNNARYLEFLEQARWHYFQQLNMSEICAKFNWLWYIWIFSTVKQLSAMKPF